MMITKHNDYCVSMPIHSIRSWYYDLVTGVLHSHLLEDQEKALIANIAAEVTKEYRYDVNTTLIFRSCSGQKDFLETGKIVRLFVRPINL